MCSCQIVTQCSGVSAKQSFKWIENMSAENAADWLQLGRVGKASLIRYGLHVPWTALILLCLNILHSHYKLTAGDQLLWLTALQWPLSPRVCVCVFQVKMASECGSGLKELDNLCRHFVFSSDVKLKTHAKGLQIFSASSFSLSRSAPLSGPAHSWQNECPQSQTLE